MTAMRYYDPEYGRDRIKRRYVWCAWGFVVGAFCGSLISWELIRILSG